MNELSRFTKLPKTRLKLAVAITFFLIFCCILSAKSQTLVWQDNFDATALNGDSWTYDFGDGSERAAGYGWGNSELEYYTSRTQNVRVEDGSLLIEARKENFGPSSNFTSGRIKTEGRVHFKYGTVEARIKLPDMTKGLWPAFWTLGTIGGTWPSIGEIDMMEAGSAEALAAGLGNKRVSSASHWSNADGGHEYNVSYQDAAVDLSADYHLYKMVWTKDYIKMYLDNIEFYSFDISDANAPYYSEFHTPHFLLLNIAVGGQYTGIFDANGITAPLPGKMYVDYIRLYQNPGDELYIGTEHAATGNFGVFTDNTPVSDSLTYGTDATLYYWNNLTNITNPTPIPFEGDNVWAVHAAANDWFGLGIANNYVNLTNFATGSLKFHFKTTYSGQFKIGIKTGHGESWINFPDGVQQYGLVRDGSWHEISIPLADYNNSSEGRNIDLFSVNGAFMFAGDPAVSEADFYLDNIYYSGGISPNPLPTVALTSPVNNDIFITPASVTINADAADENGSVAKVDFYSGNTLLATDDSSPYSFTWNNPPVKVDTITAKATDNEGAVTTSAPVIIFVSAPGNTTPTASITSPANNASFLTPASITINADANDVTGGIYKVEFYSGTTLLATSTTSPYTYKWTGAIAGNYALTVKATDNGGLSATSSVVNISVADPIKPTVSITSPLNNSHFTPPASIQINADAADANGTVSKVEFYNGTSLLGIDDSEPYSFTWNDVAKGNYSLTAKATDNDGNETVSSPVNISVAPNTCTGTAVSGDYSYEVYSDAGTVYYTFHPLAPIAGCSYALIYLREGNGTGVYPGYNMVASGSDFIFSKSIADGTLTSFYFSYNVPSGGERNSSANPHAYVAGTVCVAGAPTVSITSPAEGASFNAPATITINADANDGDGTVSKVEFYGGTDFLGMDDTAPYSFDWTNVAAASYSLTAVATDNSGLKTTSIPVNIVVNVANTDGYCGTAFSGDYEYKAETANGIVTFTFHPLSPIAGCSYSLIYIREGLTGGYPGYGMTASGSDFIFTKSIADATPVSFYFTYNVPSGGERNSSANPHSYTVGTNCTGVTGTAPTVSITSPIANASFTEPATITIAADAEDIDGIVSNVEFYSGAILLGNDDTKPYSFDWINVPAGNYIITVKATDNSALFTISLPVKVTVNINNDGGFCGTVNNGDYSYKAETIAENVVFEFHPLAPIAGCSYAFIYIREGLTGDYPGYPMTAIGSDFTFTKPIASGTPISIYFTYNVPSGGERNSSATPHDYIVGTVCDGLLPVSLIHFNAALQSNGTVLLGWSTATESGNKGFYIEKSNDNIHWSQIGFVAGAGYSSTLKEYNFADATPLSGNNYYRLNQTDNDGHFNLSNVQFLNFIKKAVTDILVYPNPAANEITVSFSETPSAAARYSLINASGVTVKADLLKDEISNNKASINVSSLPSGRYIFYFNDAEFTKSINIIIQH